MSEVRAHVVYRVCSDVKPCGACASSIELGEFRSRCVRRDPNARIGTTHGLMGHVLLVLSAPMCVPRRSEEGEMLQAARWQARGSG